MQDPSTLKLQTHRINNILNSNSNPLPLTTFLLNSASSVPDSPKTHLNYLNSDTCSKRIPSMQTSHPNPTHLNKMSHYCPQVFLRLATQNQDFYIQNSRISPLSSLLLKSHSSPPRPHFQLLPNCFHIYITEPSPGPQNLYTLYIISAVLSYLCALEWRSDLHTPSLLWTLLTHHQSNLQSLYGLCLLDPCK